MCDDDGRGWCALLIAIGVALTGGAASSLAMSSSYVIAVVCWCAWSSVSFESSGRLFCHRSAWYGGADRSDWGLPVYNAFALIVLLECHFGRRTSTAEHRLLTDRQTMTRCTAHVLRVRETAQVRWMIHQNIALAMIAPVSSRLKLTRLSTTAVG
jgi:hypothetical protein